MSVEYKVELDYTLDKLQKNIFKESNFKFVNIFAFYFKIIIIHYIRNI